MKKFGPYIRDLRNTAGETLQTVSKALGISVSLLAKMEKSETATVTSISKLDALARKLNLKPESRADLLLRAFITAGEIALPVSGVSREQVQLGILLASTWKQLTETDVNGISAIVTSRMLAVQAERKPRGRPRGLPRVRDLAEVPSETAVSTESADAVVTDEETESDAVPTAT